MMLRAALVALTFALSLALSVPGASVLAESVPAATESDTYAVMRIPELLEVLRDEGQAYGRDLAGQMFDDPDHPGWDATVAAIYDPARMSGLFRGAFDRALDGDEEVRAATAAFFGAEPGRAILRLEIEARRALLDDAVQEAAALAYADLEERRDPRVVLLQEFAAVNDLVETNVAGTMNANMAFLKAMAAAGGAPRDEGEMLAEVWGQEDQVRADTEAWLFPFLALAYQPLSDAELKAYVAFSASPEGQRLNRALFAGFDAVFEAVSADLGRAAGLELRGRDI